MNLFVGSTLHVEDVAGTDVEMVQETDYPWDGNVAITVEPGSRARRFTMRIRVPGPRRQHALHEHAGSERR